MQIGDKCNLLAWFSGLKTKSVKSNEAMIPTNYAVVDYRVTPLFHTNQKTSDSISGKRNYSQFFRMTEKWNLKNAKVDSYRMRLPSSRWRITREISLVSLFLSFLSIRVAVKRLSSLKTSSRIRSVYKTKKIETRKISRPKLDLLRMKEF